VTLNQARRMTGIFAGELAQAHRAGCAACAEVATVPVEKLYDIVVTTNSGYPLDQNPAGGRGALGPTAACA